MLGLNTFYWLDKRCKQATGRLSDPFGGLSIILFGDFGQLSPVGDSPLYSVLRSTESSASRKSTASLLYRMFTTVVILEAQQRQQGSDPEQERFRQLLQKLRDGEADQPEWELLSSRFVTADNLPSFAGAIRLFTSNADVNTYNEQRLRALGRPITRFDAVHNVRAAAGADSNDANGLLATLYLCEGAEVMLTTNLWQEQGLCNGAAGTVRHVVYAHDTEPPVLPVAVIVEFPDYRGPEFAGLPRCVPIIPIRADWDHKGKVFSRTQVPLRLRYAMTVHKSQGQTLDEMVGDIGPSESSAGLTFVAISRVRRLDHMLLQPFSLDRLKSIGSAPMMQQRRLAEVRLRQFARSNVSSVTDIVPSVGASSPSPSPSSSSASTSSSAPSASASSALASSSSSPSSSLASSSSSSSASSSPPSAVAPRATTRTVFFPSASFSVTVSYVPPMPSPSSSFSVSSSSLALMSTTSVPAATSGTSGSSVSVAPSVLVSSAAAVSSLNGGLMDLDVPGAGASLPSTESSSSSLLAQGASAPAASVSSSVAGLLSGLRVGLMRYRSDWATPYFAAVPTMTWVYVPLLFAAVKYPYQRSRWFLENWSQWPALVQMVSDSLARRPLDIELVQHHFEASAGYIPDHVQDRLLRDGALLPMHAILEPLARTSHREAVAALVYFAFCNLNV